MSQKTDSILPNVIVAIPAAGVGSRMGASQPKQYLSLLGQTVLEHTVNKFLSLDCVQNVVIAISKTDPYFNQLPIASHPKVVVVDGGKERADSVANAVNWAKGKCKDKENDWILVHDAARPCVDKRDVLNLIKQAQTSQRNAILGMPVKDTMKRTKKRSYSQDFIQSTGASVAGEQIDHTVSRNQLWHAFTPQCCKLSELSSALTELTNDKGQLDGRVTDEASALELCGFDVDIIESSPKNIKITVPDDLLLAEFYLKSENNEH